MNVPPSTLRVVLLVSVLSLRRFANRISHLRSRGKKNGKRTATARKATGGKLLIAFMALSFVFQASTMSASLVRNVAAAAEQAENRGFELVSQSTFDRARFAEEARADPEADAEEAREALHAAVRNEGFQIRDEVARKAYRQRLLQRFESQGSAAFRVSVVPAMAAFPDTDLWYRGSDPQGMLRPLGLVGIILGLAIALQHLGADRDLAKVDGALEWLFTFPVPARSLFLSRALEAALIGPLVMALIWPFYAVLYWCAGYRWLGVPLGAGAALYTGALAGGLRVAVETVLRRTLSLSTVARVQSVLLVLSYVGLVGAFAVAFSPRVQWLAKISETLPPALLYTPFALPVWLTVGGKTAVLAGLLAVFVLVALLALAIGVAEYTVRGGITPGSGELSASRAPSERSHVLAPAALRGVVLKELRAVLRDRQLRAQALITPLVLIGLQLWLNPALFYGILENPRNVATAAFALSMLVLATGACGALATEGPALWMLYGVPQRIERSLVAKLTVWVALGLTFSLAMLVAVGVRSPLLLLRTLPHLALVVPGVVLYAVIAFGLGTLGTDPLEPEPRRRLRVGSVNLFMILASMFAYALYVPSLWAKLTQLVLSALLAFALWQKVKDQAPFLLDPTEAPPASIAVADGVMAALGFFVLQGVIVLAAARFDLPVGQTVLIAFVTAGCLVTLTTLLVFELSSIPSLYRALGLRAPSGYRFYDRVRAVALGLGVGLVAAGLAVLYLQIIDRVPFLRALKQQALDGGESQQHLALGAWLFPLAVVAAPLFEEFIFRAVLFRGFRRSLSALGAALASAAVFALVHPAIAAVPVFLFALLAALAYDRSRWLVTPILAHMTYNAIVLFASIR
ncbi:MAG TPA: CPBP family intramembrane glutamic endopeptidase [Polyangiaceae bacterium]|nr:CPBP family intramembrane glutamic endopeptidase [Polyangiaceae bacterium]